MDKITKDSLCTYIAQNAATMQTIVKQTKYADIIAILDRLNPEHITMPSITNLQIDTLISLTDTMYDTAVKLNESQYIADTKFLVNWVNDYKQSDKSVESLLADKSTFVVDVINHRTIVNQLLFEITHTDTKWTLIPNDFFYTIYKNRLQQTGATPLGKTNFLRLVSSLIVDYPDWTLKTNCTVIRNDKNMPNDDPIIKRFCMNKWLEDNKNTPSFRGLVKKKGE